MKKALVASLVLLVVSAAFAEPFFQKDKGNSGRMLTGKVLDHNDNPLSNAVVYLTNTRTRTVKTYIVAQDGVYRFSALSLNIDYEIYAQLNGRKSDTKTVSQFDSRSQVNQNLKINMK